MIFLDNQTRPYLERLINNLVEKSDKDFIAKRIQKMLEADRERLGRISSCKHQWGSYTGHKICCSKCGAFDEGMGENWKLDGKLKIK